MKSLSVVFALVLLVVTPVFAADAVPNAEQEKLVQHLQRTGEKFLKSVDGLSEAQWNFKAAPDKWSIAQCAEHIAAAETLIRGAVEKGLTTPLEAGQPVAELVKDDLVTTMVVDRSKKFSAPEPLVPTDRFGSPAAAVDAFRKERDETIKLAKGDMNFRAHAVKHPGFGMLDTYGWMLFLSAHSERHTLQIEEVKAHADYPKN
ncbi:MAG TPA: DinB family protein [Thermoanaerobaculia bacterium]|nr:DinB family protein [Thermoanaerobaculia bacterium]